MPTLEVVFEQALAFLPSQTNVLSVPQETLVKYAQNEAASGCINVGPTGLTQGMNAHLVSQGNNFLKEWNEVRKPFDLEIQPYLHSIKALEEAKKKAVEVKNSMAGLTSQIKEKAAARLDYSEAEKKSEDTNRQYEKIKSNEGGREANLGTYSLFYWPALFLIGVAEWLINYDTFLTFLDVHAIAIGVTIVLGILLAFAAHGHGTLFKQWSYRFGAHRRDTDRRGEWRYFTLSTFSLLLVLLAAGGSRYESLMRDANINVGSSVGSSMGSSISGDTSTNTDSSVDKNVPNLLGDEANTQSHPLRDVLLSLLANLAAWSVGVFLSYLLHDENPIYMRAAYDFKKAHKKFAKLHKQYVENEITRRDAVLEKEIEELLTSAADKSEKVREQLDMWEALSNRDAEIKSSVAKIIEDGLGTYRNALMQVAGVQFKMSGIAMRPEEYAMIPLSFE